MIENAATERLQPVREPEHILMLKVLKLAIDDLREPRGSHTKKMKLKREAKQWFLSDQPDWPFSFVNLCETLGLEPQAVLDRLKEHLGT